MLWCIYCVLLLLLLLGCMGGRSESNFVLGYLIDGVWGGYASGFESIFVGCFFFLNTRAGCNNKYSILSVD